MNEKHYFAASDDSSMVLADYNAYMSGGQHEVRGR
jgi:hypothetical protein